MVISLLVLTFLFFLGYWIGHDTGLAGKTAPGFNVLSAAEPDSRLAERLGQDFTPFAAAETAEPRGLEVLPKAEPEPAPMPVVIPPAAIAQSVAPPVVRAAAPAPAVVARPPVPPASAVIADGKFHVQVASLSSRSAADALVKTLEGRHYKASITSTTVNGKEFFRVRVGGYDTFEDATRVVNNLHASGIASGCYIIQN